MSFSSSTQMMELVGLPVCLKGIEAGIYRPQSKAATAGVNRPGG
jgi:hypothetical protein